MKNEPISISHKYADAAVCKQNNKTQNHGEYIGSESVGTVKLQ